MTDPAAGSWFRELYRTNVHGLVGYVLRRVESADDAADVVAETFLVAWRRLEEVPSGDGARLWLYGVARRLVANQRRGEMRRLRLADRIRRHVAAVPVDHSGTTIEAMAVRGALATLSEADQELLRLTSWEGLSPSQVGLVMELAPGTVRTRLRRARQRLRTRLETEGLGLGDESADRGQT